MGQVKHYIQQHEGRVMRWYLQEFPQGSLGADLMHAEDFMITFRLHSVSVSM